MRGILWGLVVATSAALAGCKPAGDNPTNVIQVQGKAVAPDGTPARWLNLTFYPTQPGGTSASALVGADGTFTPKTLNNQDGIVPGTYRVQVEPLKKDGATQVAPKYSNEAATDLEVTLKSGDSTLTVQLK
jgi:hypothetical protein